VWIVCSLSPHRLATANTGARKQMLVSQPKVDFAGTTASAYFYLQAAP